MREVEQPPHLELVGLLGQVAGEILDGLGHVGDVGQPRPGPGRQEATVTRALVHPVVHLRLVQMGDAKRLEQLKPEVGDLRNGNPACVLERPDRRRHLTAEGVKLPLQHAGLRAVDRRHPRRARRRQGVCDERLGSRNDLPANLAQRAEIVDRVGRQGGLSQAEHGFHVAREVVDVLDAAGRSQRRCDAAGHHRGRTGCGRQVAGDGFDIRDPFQDAEPGGQTDDTADVAGTEAVESTAEFGAQVGDGHRAHQPPVRGARVDRHTSGQRDDVLSALQRVKHLDRRFQRLHDDDAERDRVRPRQRLPL